MNQMGPDVHRVSVSVAESMRENPLGAALLGIGLVWLLSSRTGAPQVVGRVLHTAGDALSAGGSSVGRAAARVGASLADGAASVGAAVGETADAAAEAIQGRAARLAAATRDTAMGAMESAHDLAGRAGDASSEIARGWSDEHAPAGTGATLASAGSGAMSRLGAGRDWLARTLEKEPLILAAGALATGAAIAATLPILDVERRTFGAAAREAVDAAAGMAREGAAAAGGVAADMAQAAKDEAARQGLTPDRLEQQAGELADKARAAAPETANKLL